MKVILIDNLQKGNRYMDLWSESIPNLIASWGFEVMSISTNYPMTNLSPAERSKKSSSKLLDQLFANVVNDKISSEDIIIFADAKDFIVFPIVELLRLKGLKTKVAAFWQSGVYYQFSDIKKKLSESDVRIQKYYERALAGVYDYNLIPDEKHETYFTISYDDRRTSKKTVRCNFPYAIDLEPEEEFVKEDIIVYNAAPEDEVNWEVFNYVKNAFPDYNFYVTHTEVLTAQEYSQLLKRAKVLFNTNKTESNPYIILESMMYGAIPILPDYPLYDEIFPEIDKYDRRLLTPPYLKLIRNDEQILEPIKKYMENYDKYREELLIPTREKIKDTYFSTDNFKDFLCKVMKR